MEEPETTEQQEEPQVKKMAMTKINTKSKYRVYISSYNGKNYYRLLLPQKNFDGTTVNYYQTVYFKKTLPLPANGETIVINQFIENLFGENKYEPRRQYTIVDYTSYKTQEMINNEALDEFGMTLAQNENEVDIDDNFLD